MIPRPGSTPPAAHDDGSASSGREGSARTPAWHRRPQWVDAALAALVFIVALTTYVSGIPDTDLHPDESRWINRAHYFADAVDPFGPTWNDQYLTRGQPPFGSYMMGLGLVVQGRDLDTNLAWDFRRARGFNVDNGMVPSEGDLNAGRRWNAFLGSLAAVVVFFIGRDLMNRTAGLVAAALLIANPLQTWHNRLALADTTLTLTLALTLLCVILLMKRPRWLWAILIGILLGVGGANKLTPLALTAPLAFIGGLLFLRAIMDARTLPGNHRIGWHLLPARHHLSWKLLSTPLVALATFVVVYPYLWPNPVRRTLNLLQFRTEEMANQARIFSQFRVDNPLQALERTWANLGGRWSATQEFFHAIGLDTLGAWLAPLDVVLAVIGLTVMFIIGMRQGLQSKHLMVALVIFTQTATIILSMRTDFERYYLPILLGLTISAGLTVGLLVDVISRRLQPHDRERPT